MSNLRVRFAPSPTGFLHIGGARTALFNWLLARHWGGTFILRIEDTDQLRSVPAYTAAILDALRWLGLDWDEGPEVGGPCGPYYQTQRIESYRVAAERLLSKGLAYHCFCQTRDRAHLAAAPIGNDDTGEPETEMPERAACRCNLLDRNEVRQHQAKNSYAIRFRAPREGETRLTDLIHGSVIFRNQEIGDFIILRADGIATYNFAATLDDAAMQVSHVLRGDDHLSNTPKQIMLYQALELPVPFFGHLPMILGPDKKRLSKRHGAVSIQQFREDGYLPEALINYLARLGWSHGDQEVFSREELVILFDLGGVGKSPCVFDYAKLEWLNAEWMRRLGASEMSRRASILWEQRSWLDCQQAALPRLAAITTMLLERSRTLVQLADKARYFFDIPLERDTAAETQLLVPAIRPILIELADRLEALTDWSVPEIERIFRELAACHGRKAGDVIQPARVALTGGKVSPGMFEVVCLLGSQLAARRLRQAGERIAQPAKGR
ncbi:MAG: glutamate--tRNA ligase [Cyanobacteria bacterium NC_groundwater_1444_Ag_S-0.65um_54_12]|nr:glutamate--tRNA ligase [Cyanobacteria bacterium NC_groundwater_1444_Ag_S-0.65um_54_12]